MKTVKRADLVDAAYLAAAAITRADARALVDEVFALIADALAAGSRVKISRFATFSPRAKKARVGRNPKRPEEAAVIAARTIVLFKAMPELKDAINAGGRVQRRPPDRRTAE